MNNASWKGAQDSETGYIMHTRTQIPPHKVSVIWSCSKEGASELASKDRKTCMQHPFTIHWAFHLDQSPKGLGTWPWTRPRSWSQGGLWHQADLLMCKSALISLLQVHHWLPVFLDHSWHSCLPSSNHYRHCTTAQHMFLSTSTFPEWPSCNPSPHPCGLPALVYPLSHCVPHTSVCLYTRKKHSNPSPQFDWHGTSAHIDAKW